MTNDDVLRQQRERLASHLESRAEEISRLRMAVGFDGFVDEICRVVATRNGPEEFVPVEDIADWSRRIGAAAGVSTNFEIVVERIKVGGNAPIMALALARLGVKVTCIGTLGDGAIDPVFHPLAAAGVELITLGPPAHTDALEFRDGKLMLGKLETLKQVTWAHLEATVGLERLRELARTCHLIAHVNWTMLPYLGDIWRQWADFVSPYAEQRIDGRVRQYPGLLFVDLADPHKRPPEQLRSALVTLGLIGRRQPVYLGLNWREAVAVNSVLQLDDTGSPNSLREGRTWRPGPDSLLPFVSRLGSGLAELGLQGVFVHPTEEAAGWRLSATSTRGIGDALDDAGETAGSRATPEEAWVPGPYTPHPRITTGAGDNFNAGVALGLCLRLPVRDILWLGKGMSGYYVRHGESPSLPQLIDFLRSDSWRPSPETHRGA